LWYSHLRRLVENPEIITTMGENLYNTVNGRYDMKSVCTQRRELYTKLVSDKRTLNLI